MIQSARLDPVGVDALGFSAAARTQSSTRAFCEMEYPKGARAWFRAAKV
jgi:hypothetical protein